MGKERKEMEEQLINYFKELTKGSEWIKAEEAKLGKSITYLDDNGFIFFLDEYEQIAPKQAKAVLKLNNDRRQKYLDEKKTMEIMGLSLSLDEETDGGEELTEQIKNLLG